MIRIPAPLLADIEAQAAGSYPRECCGLLVGRQDGQGDVIVSQIFPSPNLAPANRADRFEIDPQVRFDVMRKYKDKADDIVGHYHSHPDHPAEPSATDLSMAFEPEFIWLITACTPGETGPTTAWQLNRDTRQILSLQMA